MTIAFTVPDLEGYFADLRKAGIQTLDAPTRRPWGAFNFYLLDPDGYHIEVEQA